MTQDALAPLSRFSAALGRDPEQVQAAGGNTSVKLDGVLWVKASGLWLADAERRPTFVPVDLPHVLLGVRAGAADPVGPAVLAALNPEGLRPSIETTLHALLPHAFVVHTHSVRTIALAIREDGPALLAPRLAGLRWSFVPYCMPGLPLTLALASELAHGTVDVVVLGNHGLVVGADTLDAAAALLALVERRLDAPARASAAIACPPAPEGLRPVRHAAANALGVEPATLERVAAGSLYPDHVIFLGPAATVLPANEEGPDVVRSRLEQASAAGSKLLLRAGGGAYVPAEAGESTDELALCLTLVMARVPDEAVLRYLTSEDEAALLDWDAEKYRQALAAARSGSG